MVIGEMLPSQHAINLEALAKNSADIRRNQDTRPRLQLRVVLDLTTAQVSGNPLQISNPFDGFYVESATDTSTSVNMSFTSNEAQNISQYTSVKQNDSASFSAPLAGALLTWAAQSGKTMTIVFYLGVQFRPGSQFSAVSGGVNITAGTGMTPVAAVSVTSTATAILAADTSRKKATLENRGSQIVYLSGTSGVVATAAAGDLAGVSLNPGDVYEWISTGAIYGITATGASVVSINTES